MPSIRTCNLTASSFEKGSECVALVWIRGNSNCDIQCGRAERSNWQRTFVDSVADLSSDRRSRSNVVSAQDRDRFIVAEPEEHVTGAKPAQVWCTSCRIVSLLNGRPSVSRIFITPGARIRSNANEGDGVTVLQSKKCLSCSRRLTGHSMSLGLTLHSIQKTARTCARSGHKLLLRFSCDVH